MKAPGSHAGHDPVSVIARLLIGLGGLVLIVAYVAICRHVHSPWPWLLPVHEDGVRTLLDTLLYYEHATRELPIDLLLGVAVGGSAYAAFPAQTENRRRTMAVGVALLTVVAVILVGAAIQTGAKSVLENLLQNHTRPGAPLVWGSHWRYHLLERFPLIVVNLGVAALAAAGLGSARGRTGQVGRRVVYAVIAIYLVLTAIFTRSLADLRLPFLDPQYLGHEAREIMTHVIVTLPVAWGGCLLLRPDRGVGAVAPLGVWGRSLLSALPWLAFTGAAWIYALIAALGADAASHGQTTDWTILVFPHFFEHGFTYVVTPLAAALTYGLCGRHDEVA